MNGIKDKYLIYKIKRLNDPEVFGQLYDDFVDKIYRFIYFKVPTTQEAEDLTSEVFLKLWQSIQTQEKITNLKAYIYKIARNTVVDYYRKKSTQSEVLLDEEQHQSLKADSELIQKIGRESDIKVLFAAVNDLKDEYKEVIILRYIDELSISEISQIIEKSRGATRTLIHRALNTLREILKTVNSEQ